jgi:GNAT superfamily N-acetyltransferase
VVAAEGRSLVRAREDADVDRCVDLVAEVQRRDGYPGRWVTDHRGFLVSTDALGAWVVEAGDRGLVGHVALHAGSTREAVARASEASALPADRLAFVARLVVAPEARRAGVGTALLGAAVSAARDRGRRAVLDVVVAHTSAIAFYDHLGWTNAGPITAHLSDGTTFDELIYLAPA